jgi:hypothetical protein
MSTIPRGDGTTPTGTTLAAPGTVDVSGAVELGCVVEAGAIELGCVVEAGAVAEVGTSGFAATSGSAGVADAAGMPSRGTVGAPGAALSQTHHNGVTRMSTRGSPAPGGRTHV